MARVNPATFDLQQMANSLAGGSHLIDTQALRQKEAQLAEHAIPVRNDVRYQNPILQGVGNFGRSLASGIQNLISAPGQAVQQGQDFISGGAQGRDAANAELEAFFTTGVRPQNPSRGFLQAIAGNQALQRN
jgi:hypothetical protein